LPTADNTHEVAQRVAPESRVVYVDNDPLVLAHARGLLASTPEGACDYLDADLREPAAILDAAAGLLDFTQPIALMLTGIMGHSTDEEAHACWTAAISRSTTALTSTRGSTRLSAATTKAVRCPTTSAATHTGSLPRSIHTAVSHASGERPPRGQGMTRHGA
jgi:hypothetical protein